MCGTSPRDREGEMNRWTKLGIVLGGYAVSLVVSVIAVAIYDRQFSPADSQAMSGMIAGGETMFGAGVFFLLSLIPTCAGLWFLRSSRKAWSLLSIGSLVLATAGLVSVVFMLAHNNYKTNPQGTLMLVDLIGILQMLSAPLWIAGFALFAVLAPA